MLYDAFLEFYLFHTMSCIKLRLAPTLTGMCCNVDIQLARNGWLRLLVHTLGHKYEP